MKPVPIHYPRSTQIKDPREDPFMRGRNHGKRADRNALTYLPWTETPILWHQVKSTAIASFLCVISSFLGFHFSVTKTFYKNELVDEGFILSYSFRGVLVGFCWCDKHHDPKQHREETVYMILDFSIQSIMKGKSLRQARGSRSWSRDHGGNTAYWLCLFWLAQLPFWDRQAIPPAQGWHHPKVRLYQSISNQKKCFIGLPTVQSDGVILSIRIS